MSTNLKPLCDTRAPCEPTHSSHFTSKEEKTDKSTTYTINHHALNIHFFAKWGWCLINCVSKSSYPWVSICSSVGQLSRRWEAEEEEGTERGTEPDRKKGWMDERGRWMEEGEGGGHCPTLATASLPDAHMIPPPWRRNLSAWLRILDHQLRKAPVLSCTAVI